MYLNLCLDVRYFAEDPLLAISQLVERCVPGTFSAAASLDIEAHARRKAVYWITDRHNNTGRWLPLVEAHEVWIADEMVVVCRW